MKNTSLQLSVPEQTIVDELLRFFKKYNNQIRLFGLRRTHSHFHLETGELLIGRTDPTVRVLTISPCADDTVIATAAETAWTMINGQVAASQYYCETDPEHNLIQRKTLTDFEKRVLSHAFVLLGDYAEIFEFFLVHEPLPLKRGEVLVEYNNPDTRVLTIKPMLPAQLIEMPVATAWRRGRESTILVNQFCYDEPHFS